MLANTNEPSATRTTAQTETVGYGNGIDLLGEEVPQPTPGKDAERDADDDADHGVDRRLPRHGRRQLSPDEAHRLQSANSRRR